MGKKLLTVFVLLLVILLSTSVFAQTSQTLTLKPGFNFVSFTTSISLTPSTFKALNTSIEDIYLFSAAAGSFLSANEGTLTSLAAGKGYIVKSSASLNVSVSVSGTAISTIGNISLKSGFNLVGFSKAPGTATKFSQLMGTYSFVNGLYKWSAAAGSFIQVVRDNSGTPVQIDGTDPSFAAGESYFFNITEDTLINYDGTSVLMGKTIEPPVVTTDNPFAGTYTGTFAGNAGAPQGTFTLTVSIAGALTGSGYNNSNTPATAISPSGTVTTAGSATFYVTFNNSHKFGGTFTSTGASGNFYETDGTTVKGTWSATKNAVTPQTVAAPVITPAGGTFTTSQSVTITCATSGATIKYTTDGSTPSSTAGNTYSAAITVSATTVIKAVGIKSGMTDSSVTMASFTIGTQPAGTVPFLRKFGSKGTGNGQFTSGPINVAIDPATGYVFVSDTYGHRIQKFDSNGNFVSAFGSMGTGNGQFQYPTGIAITQGGDMYVVDYGNKRVQKFSTGGTFKLAFGTAGTGNGQFQAPDCVAVEKYGSVYVTDFMNNSVQRFSSEGNFTQKWGGAGTGNGQFGTNSPKDIAIDSSDNVYVADIGNNRIQKFNVYGTYQSQWGTSGSGDGQFTSPHGVCVDSDGHVFVSDKSCRIQKFSPMGDFILSWGSSGTADGQFTDPSGICADSIGNIYVADFGNSRVQVFGPGTTPTVETVATPAISPAGGTYTSAQSVTITCSTSGATIYYTTDGTTPSASNGTVYGSAISVTATKTIKAIAVKTGMTDSEAASAAFTISIAPAAEILTIDLGGGVTMEMIKVAAAGKSFQMGCPTTEQDGDFYDGPAHTVSFTKDYYICKYEVTQAQWMKIYGSWPGGAQAPSTTYGAGDSYPAYYVSWSEICSAGGFLEKLNTIKPGGYNGFRLPTEAEWEYAARGGTQTRYYWGDDSTYSLIGNYAWYYNNSSSKSRPAGEKSPNAFGIYDMSGNVFELCSDYYGYYGTSALTDPTGPASGTTHVLRGGSFGSEPKFCRSAARASITASDRSQFYGFRIALTAGQTPAEEKVQAPVITPSGGTFTAAQSVTISCATSGAVIYYTTDGTVPSSSNGGLYSGAITVSSTATVKAIAVKSGMADSLISSSVITISSTTFSGFTAIGSEPLGKRQQAAAASHNGKLWAIGGRGSAGQMSDVWSSSDGSSWTEIKANNAAAFSARINHAVVSYAGKLWIIGGYSSTAFADLNDVWSSSDGVAWTEVASISTSTFTRRARHAVVVFNDKMYMIGGYGDGSYFSDVLSSTDGLNWQTVNSNAGFGGRAYHSCVVFNNKLWVIGGAISSTGYKNDVWSSPDGVTWTQETSSAAFSARQGHECFVYGNKMWVVGGQETVGYSNEVWSSSDGINWSKPAMTNTIAAGRAFSAGAVFNDKMWVIGGGQGSSIHLGDIYYSNY